MIEPETIPSVAMASGILLDEVDNPNAPIEGLGELSLEVSNKLRTLAILAILAEAVCFLLLRAFLVPYFLLGWPPWF